MQILFRLRMMDMTDGDGKRIRSVGRFGCDLQIKQAGDHELHLLFGGETVANDGTLDAEWSVLGNRQVAVGRSQHGHAAHLTELEGTLGVRGEEDLFNGDDIWLPLLQQRGQLGIHLREPHWCAVLLGQLDGPGTEKAQTVSAGRLHDIDDAIASKLRAAIDAEDTHTYESNPSEIRRRCTAPAPVTIKPVDESMSQSRNFATGQLITVTIRACAAGLFGLLMASNVAAQSTAPVVIARTPGMAPATVQPDAMNRMTVVLDAGHGGADAGAHISTQGGNTILEKDVTLALALRLQALLTARGFLVVMTRNSDAARDAGVAAPVTVDDRAGVANSARASACLLLHAAGSGHGVHLYTSELNGVSSEASVLPWTTAQAAWVSQSAQLSQRMGAALQEAGVPRLVRRASVQPLDSLTCPAVVVELAPEGVDARSVNDAGYQQRVAQALAGALEAWALRVKAPPQQPNTLGRPRTAEVRP